MPEIGVKLKPFNTPNFAVFDRVGVYSRKEPPPGIPLNELPKATIDAMIDEWVAEVRRKWAEGRTDKEEGTA